MILRRGQEVAWLDSRGDDVYVVKARITAVRDMENGMQEIHTDHGMAIADEEGRSGHFMPLDRELDAELDQPMKMEPLGPLPSDLKWIVEQPRDLRRERDDYGW